MMIVMKPEAGEAEIAAVVERVEAGGCSAHVSAGELVTVIGAIGERERVQRLGLDGAPGVDRVVPILKPYKLSSSQFRHGTRSVLEIGDARVGGSEPLALIAGPCTVESREQTLDRRRLRRRGRRPDAPRRRLQAANLARTRSRVSGLEGLQILQEAKQRTGLPIVTELIDVREVDDVAEVADVIQIGARNMQNYNLLTRGRADRLRRPAQARPLGDARGAADGLRVRPQGGQRAGHALRARDPHARERLPVHARPARDSCAA